jgi:hypothetical protein
MDTMKTLGSNGFLSMIINKEYAIITEPRKYFGPVDIQKLQISKQSRHQFYLLPLALQIISN